MHSQAEQEGDLLFVDLRGRSIDSEEALWNALMGPCGLPEWFGRNLDDWKDTLRGGISSTIDNHPLILIRVERSGLFASDNPYGASFVDVTESSGKGRHVQTVPSDRYHDFPAFAPAFERGPGGTGAYLVLLNLNHLQSEAVLIVARCLNSAEDKERQVSNLLGGSSHWPLTSSDWPSSCWMRGPSGHDATGSASRCVTRLRWSFVGLTSALGHCSTGEGSQLARPC